MQLRHESSPDAAWYIPAWHAVHADPGAMAGVGAGVLAPRAKYVGLPEVKNAELPGDEDRVEAGTAGLYFPAGQSMQLVLPDND